jgi:hypothetical protein
VGRAYHVRILQRQRPDGEFDLLLSRNPTAAILYYESLDCSGDAYYALTNGTPIGGEAPEGAVGGSILVHVSPNSLGSLLPPKLIIGGDLEQLPFRRWRVPGEPQCRTFDRAILTKTARRVVLIVDIRSETPEPLQLVPGLA